MKGRSSKHPQSTNWANLLVMRVRAATRLLQHIRSAMLHFFDSPVLTPIYFLYIPTYTCHCPGAVALRTASSTTRSKTTTLYIRSFNMTAREFGDNLQQMVQNRCSINHIMTIWLEMIHGGTTSRSAGTLLYTSNFARPLWTPFGKSRPGMETLTKSTCADQQTTVVEG
jgi:hypothetical protein